MRAWRARACDDTSIDRVSLDSRQVQEAVRRLSAGHRQVLIEMYYRRRSGAELASELGIPEGTVRTRLFYALRSLRLHLEEMGWNG
jgi:RNA polymerase sigma-70 factor (ECF subfamily)